MNLEKVKAYGTKSAKSKLEPMEISRRQPSQNDVVIAIKYSGICHSDVHQARDEWGGSMFPMVPGHEIAGEVVAVGPGAKKFKVGQRVGVGCYVDSCRVCNFCMRGEQSYCVNGLQHGTYNGVEKDGKTPTMGGYSTHIVVDKDYVIKIPKNMELSHAAPLLCAGITTFSPLCHWKIKKNSNVAVSGLGGLGHMAVKLANAMGANVTVISRNDSKTAYAKSIGAKDLVSIANPEQVKNAAGKFDFILDTVSAKHDIDQLLSMVKTSGNYVLVGLPNEPLNIQPFSLVGRRISVSGSLIGGIPETQYMINFCAKKGIKPEIEIIEPKQINDAYDKLASGKSDRRFVIDCAKF